jgi:hypothetical protein
MPGAGRTHGPPATKKAGGSRHRQGRNNRHSLRDGVTAYLRALPGVPGLIASVAPRIITARLDASVGAPGPHAFAVRDGHARLAQPPASIASRTPRP